MKSSCQRCGHPRPEPACFKAECCPGSIPGLLPTPTLEEFGQNRDDFLAALADRPEQLYSWQQNECHALGPGGTCIRRPGHTDRIDPFGHNNHYSYDTDRYEEWPVGWKSDSDLLEEARALLAALHESVEIYNRPLESKVVNFLGRTS